MENISNRYLALHNEGIPQDRILCLLQLEFGVTQLHQWAAVGSIDTQEGRLSEVIRDRNKYTAPSLKEYLMELQELEAQVPSATLWDLYCSWRVNPYCSLLEAWEMAYSDNEMPKRVKGLAKQIERSVKALGDN